MAKPNTPIRPPQPLSRPGTAARPSADNGEAVTGHKPAGGTGR